MTLSFIFHLPLESGTPLLIHINQEGDEKLVPVLPMHAKTNVLEGMVCAGNTDNLKVWAGDRAKQGLAVQVPSARKGVLSGWASQWRC